MKKNYITIFLFCLAANYAFSQSYGQFIFSHPATNLTSVINATTANEGFLRAGHKYTSTLNMHNFSIERTNNTGMIAGPASFALNYLIKEANINCTQIGNQVLNCKGISIIETDINTNPQSRYAIAGTHNKGLFFSTLNSLGVPINTNSYLFPSSGPFVSKPFIVQSAFSPKNFFICGTFDTTLYVLKVDSVGTMIWSSFYHSGILSARGMMECPYTGDIVVIGVANVPLSYNKLTDGFFLKINPSNGIINTYKTYGLVTCQGFYSINKANSPNGGHGFILGGESDPLNNNGFCWFVKLDSAGNVIWNKIHEPTIGFASAPIKSVVERQVGNTYEYYGLTSNTSFGMIALKLDDDGNPASGSNEFIYNSVGTAAYATAITYTNSGNQAGIQIHGIENSSMNNYYTVNADFGGQSGCNQTLTTIALTENGSTLVTTPWIYRIGSLTECSFFSLTVTAASVSVNDACAIIISSVNNNKMNEGNVKVFPNPSSQKINLSYFLNDKSEINIELYDVFGKLMKLLYSSEPHEPGEVDLTFDLKELDMANGCYFLKIKANNSISTTKFVFYH